MLHDITGRRKPTKPKKQASAQKRKRDDVDVEKLEAAVRELNPKLAHSKFTDLPLSEPTKAGLKACHFSTLTDVQSKAIALGLKGSDILGAAKTGSGKTLAFLIPVLENLFRQQCIGADAGLGAMIISPTRELAIQIFDVLYKIGKHGHLFAAGLVIGGKSLQEEQHALARMNIVVCTPGRMLQHLSQTAAFSVDNLSMLILDEADRILDMGFQRDVDAIIEYLPSERQTLLFSATQTKKVSDLARLSLREPEYVSVHESATSATPKTLQQNYVLTPLPTKLDTLWSFIQSSKKSKLIVFFSSGKQVRFVYESFRKMQPGIPLLHLHGRQKQTARLDITTRFAASRHSCLFATDVAARGLDFPAVDWVVQFDCPEDADTYIHRVGRTARYDREGRAVLFLDPSEEEGMLERLAAKKVPIERINVRAKKQTSIQNQLQGLCFKDPELKYLGQKAFASYVRSIHVQKAKDIFQVGKYALEEFAASLGLPGAPRIKFMKGDAEAAKRLKNAPRQALSESESDDAVEETAAREGEEPVSKSKDKKPTVRTKYDRMFERRNQDVFADHYTRMITAGPSVEDATSGTGPGDLADSNEDDLFTVKRRIGADTPSHAQVSVTVDPAKDENSQEPLIIDSNRRLRALKSKKKTAKLLGLSSQKVVFDDEGVPRDAHPFEDERSVGADAKAREEARARFLEAESVRVRESDMKDREVAREKRRVKKVKVKERERAVTEQERGGVGPPLGELEVLKRPFEELAELYEDEGHGLESVRDELSQEEDGKPPNEENKKVRPSKKWFQDDSDEDEAIAAKKARRGMGHMQKQAEPETLEDLEALATGLLG